MTTVRRHIDVAAPPDGVMAVLVDVEGYPRWQREVARVEVSDRYPDGRPRVATTFIRAIGRAGSYTVEYAYPGATVMTYRLLRADMMSRHDARFAVTPAPGGSRLDVELTLELRWPVPGPVLSSLAKKGVGDMLSSVKRLAEARAA